MKKLGLLFISILFSICSFAQMVDADTVYISKAIRYKDSLFLSDSLNMSGFRIKQLLAAIDDTDAVNLGQIKDSLLYFIKWTDTIATIATKYDLDTLYDGISSFTTGSVLFGDTDGSITQDNSNLFWDNTAKSLNVGYSADQGYKLAVNGTGYFSDNLNIADGKAYRYGGIDVVRLTKGTDAYYGNTYIGEGAGYNHTGIRATANGYRAGYYNTTGSYWTANGYRAGYSNTTGSYWTANGMYAGYSNTTGNYWTANGYRAGYYNTTGSYWTANGMYAGFSNTTGSYWTANGYRAARYLADGTTGAQVFDNSVYIGANTKVSAEGVTNENVFGYNATGSGSNTVTLGDNNITDTYLKGLAHIGSFGTSAGNFITHSSGTLQERTAAQVYSDLHIADSISAKAVPGGSDTQIQYNNSGLFGGMDGFTYDGTDFNLGIGKKFDFAGNAQIWSSGSMTQIDIDSLLEVQAIVGDSPLLSIYEDSIRAHVPIYGTVSYTETDPIFSSHVSSGITSTNITNWNTAYTNRITSLTTTGSSGAATLISNTLNIPNYTLAGLGGLSSATAATTYLKLDASNDPITGQLELSAGFKATGNSYINAEKAIYSSSSIYNNFYPETDTLGVGINNGLWASRNNIHIISDSDNSAAGDIIFGFGNYDTDGAGYVEAGRFTSSGLNLSTGNLDVAGNVYGSNFSNIDALSWLIFGDSFSAGSTDYPQKVMTRTGITDTTNYADGGDKWSDQKTILNDSLAAYPTLFSGIDIVTIHLGVNDYVANTTLGTRNDSLSGSSIASICKYFIDTILTLNPDIRLYIITPPEADNGIVPYRTDNTAGWNLNDLSVLLSQIAEDYGVQLIDLYSLSQFNLSTIPTLTSDGLHPSDEGEEILGEIVANAFMNRNNKGRSITTESFIDSLDNKYLKLDATNDPITNRLELSGGFKATENSYINQEKYIYSSNSTLNFLALETDSLLPQANSGAWASRTNLYNLFDTNNSGVGTFTVGKGGVDTDDPNYVQLFQIANNGNATFTGTISASNFSGTSSGTNTGDQTLSGLGGVPTTRTISTTAPLSGGGDLSANRTLSITQATTSTNGYLSSTDWNTFNNKVSTSALANYVPYTGAAASIDMGVYDVSAANLRGVLVSNSILGGTSNIGIGSTAAEYIDLLYNSGNEYVKLKYNNSSRLRTSSLGIIIDGVANINDAYTLPVSYGTAGQVLTAQGDGGTCTWTTVLSNPMTTAGDLIYGGASGTPTRLAAGTNGYVLTMSGGNPVWAAAPGGSFSSGTSYTWTADQTFNDGVGVIFGTDDDYTIAGSTNNLTISNASNAQMNLSSSGSFIYSPDGTNYIKISNTEASIGLPTFIDGYLDITEQSAPATPASGYGRLYLDTSGNLWYKNDAGSARLLSYTIPAPPTPAPPNTDRLEAFENGQFELVHLIEYDQDYKHYRKVSLYFEYGSLTNRIPGEWKKLGLLKRIILN